MVISKVIHFWKAYDIRNLKNNVYICTDARKAAISDIQNGHHKLWLCHMRQLTYLCWVAFDEAKKHTPTLTRQWLKDQILSELPTVKSVRPKDRRKPSILYCPEACEEDMIHSSLKQNVASEMENTVMIHKTAKLIRKSITKFAGEEEADA